MPHLSLKKWVLEHDRLLVWLMILLFVATLSAACLWKYAMFLYNGLDLAIIHQTFWNSLHGRLFEQSIHPHSYLGDHAELIILPLLPLYAVFPDPRTLLVLQAVALALPAWPLFLIAKSRFARLKDGFGPYLPLLLAAVWLLNPTVQNIALYEFHILPFAIFPLCLAALAYERGRWRTFIAWLLVALLVREDVSLVVFCFGLLAWTDKKTRRWIVPPLALGAAWFIGASDLISRFAPAGGYKFLIYYSWLGDSFGGILTGLITRPLMVLRHLLSLGNLDMGLGLLLPLAFLPLAAPLALILLAGPLAQILLGAPGGSELITETHYASLFLPALFLATIAAIPKVLVRKRLFLFGQKEIAVGLPAVLLLATVYGNIMMGPLLPLALRAGSGADALEAQSAEDLVRLLPEDAPVAAGFRLLPRLSSRKDLYSLHYLFLGVTQFAEEKYPVPDDVAYAAVDERDLLDYRAQSFRTAWSAPHYRDGLTRLAELAGTELYARAPFRLIRRENGVDQTGPETEILNPEILAARGFVAAADYAPDRRILRLDFAWRPPKPCRVAVAQRYAVEIRLRTAEGQTVFGTALPLANAPERKKPDTAACRRTVSLPLPPLRPGYYFPEISIEEQDAVMLLNDIRSDERTVQNRREAARHVLPVVSVE